MIEVRSSESIQVKPALGAKPEPVVESPAMRKVIAFADKVAQADISVFISGESGTGKEVLARYIHRQSLRSDGPFVAMNCAAVPESMLEQRRSSGPIACIVSMAAEISSPPGRMSQ